MTKGATKEAGEGFRGREGRELKGVLDGFISREAQE